MKGGKTTITVISIITMKICCLWVCVVLLCIVIFAIRSEKVHSRKQIVINTDAGADDAIAILLALAYEASHKDKIEIVGIICSYGNTERHYVEQNVLKTVTVAGRSDIPIYSGAVEPILPGYEPSDYFGTDGLGDFHFHEEIIATINRTQNGIDAMIDLAKRYDDLHLISLGPLTNIALAMKLDENFLQYINQIHIMGGSVESQGNLKPGVEFNFGLDPESNNVLLNRTTANMSFLYPWELIINNPLSKEWRIDVFGQANSKYVKFLNQAERVSLERESTWIPSDAYTVASVIWPDLFTEVVSLNVNAVTDGAARGSLLIDYTNTTGKPPTTTIVQNFNATKLQELLRLYLT